MSRAQGGRTGRGANPPTTALALAGSVAFLAGAALSDTENSLYAPGLLALSLPAYIVLRRLRGKYEVTG